MNLKSKQGDRGMTSLYGGKRVSKDHLRIEICGTIDELSSFLGLAKSLVKKKKIKDFLEDIQKDLVVIASEVAATPKKLKSLKKRLDSQVIARFEKDLAVCQEQKVILKSFYLPGKNVDASVFDVARSISRRLERRTVSAKRKGMIKNKHFITYLNRLSHALFVLGRECE